MHKYISLQEAATLSSHSQEYLSLRARQGKLKALKIGRNWVTTKLWLRTYLQSAGEYKAQNGIIGKVTQKYVAPPGNLPIETVEDNLKQLFKIIFNSTRKKIPLVRQLADPIAQTLKYTGALALVLLFTVGVYNLNLGPKAEKLVFETPNYVKSFGEGFDRSAQGLALKTHFAMQNLGNGFETGLPTAISQVRAGFPGFARDVNALVQAISEGFSYGVASPAAVETFAQDYATWLGDNITSLPQTYTALDQKISEGLSNDTQAIAQGYQSFNDTISQSIKTNASTLGNGVIKLSHNIGGVANQVYNVVGNTANKVIVGAFRAVGDIREKIAKKEVKLQEEEIVEERSLTSGPEVGSPASASESIPSNPPTPSNLPIVVQQVLDTTELALLKAQVQGILTWRGDIDNLKKITDKIQSSPPQATSINAPVYIGTTGVQVAGNVSASSIGATTAGAQNLGVGLTATIGETNNANSKLTVNAESTFNSQVKLNAAFNLGTSTATNLTISTAGNLETKGAIKVLDSSDATKVTLGTDGSITATGALTIQGGANISGGTSTLSGLSVTGNTVLGDESSDTLAFRASTLDLPNSLNIDSATLYIDSSNNRIGLGTTTPARILDIFGAGPQLRISQSSSSYTDLSTASTGFFTINTTEQGIGFLDGVSIGSTYATTTPPSDGLIVQGNVGIGTTSPSKTLDVTGTLNTTGAVTFGSTLAVTGAGTFSSTLSALGTVSASSDALIGGNTTLTGDLAVQGGDITTTATTFNLLNATATTVNFAGGASTALNIGNSSGTLTISSNVFDLNAATLNLDGSAAVNIGTTADVPFDIDTSTLDIDSSGAITIDSTSTLSIDGVGNSNLSATSGNLTLSTITSGNVLITSAGTITLTGNTTVSGSLTVTGMVVSSGDVDLGDTAADTISFVGVVDTNIIPDADVTRNLGSASRQWNNIYANTLTVTNISGTITAGSTQTATWLINSDNTTNNAEISAVVFDTGTATFNSVLQWNAANDAGRVSGYDNNFLFNYPVSIFSEVSGGNQTFTSGSLFNYGQNATHAITQSGAFTGLDLDFSSNITVPNSASGNQTGVLITLKDGGASATTTGFSLAGTADYGLDLDNSVLTGADIRLFNGETIDNLYDAVVRVSTDTFRVSNNNATTNAINTLLELNHSTTGTAAAGFGSRISFGLENASGVLNEIGRLDISLTDATSASEDATFAFSTAVNGSITEFLTLTSGALTLNNATDIDIDDNSSTSLTISEGANTYLLLNTANDVTVVTLDTPVAGFSSTTLNLGTAALAKTINIGTNGTAANTINIGTGAVANTIAIGSSSATTVSIADDNWSITAAGAASFDSNLTVKDELKLTTPAALAAAVADEVHLGITDIAAGDARLGIQSESGSPIYLGNDRLRFAAATAYIQANGADELTLTAAALSPSTSDGNALGTTSLMWSDLFLASGAVINFNNGDVTLTHAADTLTLAGGNLLFSADNTLDVGASGATRPRTVYAGTSVVVGSTTTLNTNSLVGSGALTLTATSADLSLTTTTSGAIVLNSAGNVVDIDDPVISLATQATDLDIIDNTASAFTISEGSNNYFLVTTSNDVTVVTLDTPVAGSSSTTLNLGTAALAKTINIGTNATAANTINIGTGAVANTIAIGSSSATTVSIADNNWSITAAGAAQFSSTLAVTGASTLSSTLGVTGAATLSSSLAVTGESTFSSLATVARNDSTTNSVLTLLNLDRTTTGTAANGIGNRIAFRTENASGVLNEIGRLDISLTDATSASEDATFAFSTAVNGSITEFLTLTSGAITLNNATDIDIDDNSSTSLTISEGANTYLLLNTANDVTVVTLDTPVAGSTSTTLNLGTAALAKTINIGTNGAAANTINIGTGAVANTIAIGSSSATTVSITDNNWSITAAGAAQFSSTLAVTGDTTLTGDLAVNGGDITTTATTFNLANATATTVNFAGAATTIEIGAATGTTHFNSNTASTSSTTGALTVDGGVGIAGNLNVGGNTALTGTLTVTGATTLNNNLSVAGTLGLTVDNTDTGSITNILTLTHSTTGTAVAGIGTRLTFRAENASGVVNEIGRLDVSLTDVTSGSEDSTLAFSGLINNGAFTEYLSLGSTAAVFNESGADIDFRVESDTNINALFLQASDGRVGIGQAAPSGNLHVGDDATVADATVYIQSDAANRPYLRLFSGATNNLEISIGSTSDIMSSLGTLNIGVSSANELTLTATAFSPATSDGNALGTTSLMWSDLFLASGAVINFANGNVTATHSTGALAIATSNDGSGAILRLTNSSNTAGSDANIQALVGGTSGGDPAVDFQVPGGANWRVGVDNDQSDRFVIASTNQFGTADQITVSTGGVVSLLDDTASTSTTTGALVVTGGTGIGGNLNVGGNTALTGTLTVTGATTLNNTLGLIVDNTDTGSITNILTLTHSTSGTAAAGIGTRLTFRAENASGVINEIARLDVSLTDVTSGSEDSTLAFSGLVNNTAFTEYLSLGSTATVFNESGADIDFRVESDGNANMFVVDAGENHIGFGTTAHADRGYQFTLSAETATANADFNMAYFHGGGGAITIPTGTAANVATVKIDPMTWTATGTITTSATLHISDAPLAGTNKYALLVDAGDTRLDGNLLVGTTPATVGQVRLPNNTDITFRNAANTANVNLIRSISDDSIQVGSANDTLIDFLSGSITTRLDDGLLAINDTSNANMTIGLTINQGANDDSIVAFKSSDVAHGYTSGAETDTFGSIQKALAATGGLQLNSHLGAGAAAAVSWYGLAYSATDANTAKSTAARGLIEFEALQTSGNAVANIVADGNVFVVRGRVGGAATALWILDEDGDTWQNGSATISGDIVWPNSADTARITLGTNAVSHGYINAPESIYINIDSDNTAGSNVFEIGGNRTGSAGGNQYLTITDNTSIVFNEGSADIDFRIESNDNINALVIDAGANSVGILSAVNTNVGTVFGGTKTGYAGVAIDGLSLTVNAGSDAAIFFLQPANANTLVEAGSGNHAILASAWFGPATITGGVATVSNTATVYIPNAMSATVSGANYALWVDAGQARFDNTVAGTGALLVRNETDNSSVQAAIFEGDRATPAANDEAYLTFRLSDSGGTQDEVLRQTWRYVTLTGGSERTIFTVSGLRNGALDRMLTLDTAGTGNIYSDTTATLGIVADDDNSDTTSDSQIIFYRNGADSANAIWAIGSDESNSGAFTFSANNEGLGTNDRVTITTAGNVGIGTTGPGTRLEVGADRGSNTVMSLDADSILINTSNTQTAPANDAASYSLALINNNTTASNFSGIAFGSVDTGLTTQQYYAGIAAIYGDHTSTSRDSRLGFFTRSGNTYAEVLSIDGGNVGIGTTSPGRILDILKTQNSGTEGAITNSTTGTAAYAQLKTVADASQVALTSFSSGYTTSGSQIADGSLLESASTASGGFVISQQGNLPLMFYTNNSERVRIDGSGNVGIGTTSPKGILHVASSSIVDDLILNQGAVTNLVDNPSTEVDTTNWSAGGWYISAGATVSQSSTQARFGSYSLRVVTTASPNAQGAAHAIQSALSASTTYILSMWVYTDTAGDYRIMLFDNSDGQSINTLVTLSANAWQRISVSGAVDAGGMGAGNGRAALRYETAGAVTFYIDGVQVEQASSASPYADGSLGPGYTWSGTAHNSTSTRVSGAGFGYQTLNMQGGLGSAKSVFIGDSTNADVSLGLTINQGGNDNYIFALKSADVAHGITSLYETDTYGIFAKIGSTTGGLDMRGISESTIGLQLVGDHTTDNTTKSTSGSAAITLTGRLKSGTTVGNLGADANILAIINNSTTAWIVDEDGDTWQSGTISVAASTGTSTISSSTASSSRDTGALVLENGGLGVEEDIYVGGQIQCCSNGSGGITLSTTTGNLSVTTSNGGYAASITQNGDGGTAHGLEVNNNVSVAVNPTTLSVNSTTSGPLTKRGISINVANGSVDNYAIDVAAGRVQIQTSTASTSETTGALVVTGGVGIGGELNVQGVARVGNAGDTNSVLGLEVSHAFGDIAGTSGIRANVTAFEANAATTKIFHGIESNPTITASNNQNWTTTVGLRGFGAALTTSATGTGTITGAAGYWAGNGTFSGAAVTNQYGLYIESLTSGTNDYGVYIAGADTQALRVDSGITQFDGPVGIGTYLSDASTARFLRVKPNVVGSGGLGMAVEVVADYDSGVTTTGYGISFTPNITDAVFTMNSLYSIEVNNSTKGASATLTNQYGLYIQNLITGTNDYGIYIVGADTYAIWADAGAVRFDGTVEIGAPSTANTTALCWDNAGNSLIYDCNGSATDLAENFGTTDSTIEAGDIVAIDTTRQAELQDHSDDLGTITKTSKAWVVKSQTANDANIIGVISTQPNQVYGEDGVFEDSENPRPVSLAGRVPVKVNLENGPIAVGDAITSSSTPGVGMKATQAGRVVGIALEAYDGTISTNPQQSASISGNTGTIIVFVNPHWQGGDLSVGVTNDGQLTLIDTEQLRQSLGQLGLAVNTNGVLEVDTLVARKVKAQRVELADQRNGDIYCTWIDNGQLTTVKGECDTIVIDGSTGNATTTEVGTVPTTETGTESASTQTVTFSTDATSPTTVTDTTSTTTPTDTTSSSSDGVTDTTSSNGVTDTTSRSSDGVVAVSN